MLSIKNYILYFFIYLFSFSVSAAEYFEYNRSIRSMGMGGLLLPLNSPSDAVFTNPAYLGIAEGIDFELINFNFGVNGIDAYNNFSKVDLSNNGSLSTITGKPIWFGTMGKASFTMPYFGFGTYKNVTFTGVLNNPAYPNLDATLLDDSGFAVGFGFPIAPMTSFGVNLKRVTRQGGSKSIGLGGVIDALNSKSASAITNQFTSTGVGYGFDTSLMVRLPTFINPTFVISWKDVGCTAFTNTSPTGVSGPDRIQDNLSAGMGINIDLPGIDLAAGMEYDHIRESGPFGKKMHIGTELSLPLINLRAGFNQGYTTYGLGFDFFLFSLDAAYYSVEQGEYAGQTEQNRVQLGLTMEFGFDANFKLSDTSGKKRKLKQRR